MSHRFYIQSFVVASVHENRHQNPLLCRICGPTHLSSPCVRVQASLPQDSVLILESRACLLVARPVQGSGRGEHESVSSHRD